MRSKTVEKRSCSVIRCVRATQMRLDGRESQDYDTCDVHDGWTTKV